VHSYCFRHLVCHKLRSLCHTTVRLWISTRRCLLCFLRFGYVLGVQTGKLGLNTVWNIKVVQICVLLDNLQVAVANVTFDG